MSDNLTWDHVQDVTRWLDAHSDFTDNTYLLRVFKVMEEMGEVTAAVIGATGQNPRKGVTHTWDDVNEELCDVILAAMVALASGVDNAREMFLDHVLQRHARLLALEESG